MYVCMYVCMYVYTFQFYRTTRADSSIRQRIDGHRGTGGLRLQSIWVRHDRKTPNSFKARMVRLYLIIKMERNLTSP